MTTDSTVAVGVDFNDSELATRIGAGVERIVELIASQLADADEALSALAGTDMRPARPLIAVACAHTGTDPQASDVTAAGGVVEMVHLATVQHRQVVDSPRAVQGCQVVGRWHNDVAILAGDYLLAAASRLLARLGPTAVHVVAQSFARTVTGQMRAERCAAASAARADHCLRSVCEMTGSLTATAGYFGAVFGGASSRDIARTRRLGRTIGTALQISDDIGAITGDAEDGAAAVDIVRRRRSLPVLYALHEGGSAAERLRVLVAGSDWPAGDARDREVLALVRASGGVAAASRVVERYAERANDDLAGLPDSGGKRALGAVIDHVRSSHSKW